MEDTGYGFPVLERLQVVGGLRRFADQCPVCHSSSRERLIWFWLIGSGSRPRFEKDERIAHFAPEKGLSFRLAEAAGANYSAFDFDPGRYRHLKQVEKADLSGLASPDASFDVVICNHVLEHVPDVDKAISEIFRIMKPGGVAILQVPIALKLEETIELAPDSSSAERIDILGQDDHLRLFNQEGYIAVLGKAGFDVELYDAFEDMPKMATAWKLDPFEKLHLARKPL